MKLVLSNSRVLAYSKSDIFISMGNTVVNIQNRKVYQNATIAECDCLPSDIDKVGYEYRNGQFVPCAPFGKGDGNVAVFCDKDCKALKDSGIPFSQMIQHDTQTYTGDGSRTCSITFDFAVDFMIIFAVATKDYAIVTPIRGTTFIYNYDSTLEHYLCDRYNLTLTETGTTTKWVENQNAEPRYFMNDDGKTYKVMAFGHRE